MGGGLRGIGAIWIKRRAEVLMLFGVVCLYRIEIGVI